jgi:hypothetical protein
MDYTSIYLCGHEIGLGQIRQPIQLQVRQANFLFWIWNAIWKRKLACRTCSSLEDLSHRFFNLLIAYLAISHLLPGANKRVSVDNLHFEASVNTNDNCVVGATILHTCRQLRNHFRHYNPRSHPDSQSNVCIYGCLYFEVLYVMIHRFQLQT